MHLFNFENLLLIFSTYMQNLDSLARDSWFFTNFPYKTIQFAYLLKLAYKVNSWYVNIWYNIPSTSIYYACTVHKLQWITSIYTKRVSL